MKKQAIIITASILALSMAGCSQNTAGTAAATTATAAAATEATTTATEAATTTTTTTAATTTTTTTTTTATTTTTTEATEPEPVEVDPGARLFRGYVETANAAEYLMSRPDEASEQLEELTYGTILEIYPCDTEGWYTAVLGGETTGFIKAELIVEMPHTLPFGDRLFGGYVNTDTDIPLLGDADENADVIRTIPSGTQLDIYESDYEGWYMTAMMKDDGSSDMGFVKAEYISEIPAYDMDGTYEPTIADIAGRWIYETQDAGITDSYVGIPVGYYIIDEDGNYSYTTDGTSYEQGTVEVGYEEYSDGSRIPLFLFRSAEGEVFMACSAVAPAERHEGCLYIGNGGAARLVPDNGNAIGGTDNASAPNEYGFYELTDPPVSGVSVAALEGTWVNADDSSEKVIITRNEDDLYNGTFALADDSGVAASGYVKLEYLLGPENSKTFWYTFYLEGGTLWNGFGVSGDLPLEELYSGQDGALHLVREAS